MQIPSWLTSSEDETKLALTVKGILTGIVPVLLLISNVRGWHLTQTGLDTAIDDILTVLSAFGALVSAVITTYGVIRKINNAQPTPPTNPPSSSI